jgi:IS5 family transposase
VHADKGYDYAHCRESLKRRGVAARIARRGIESSEKLGRHRWVVERTHAWLAGFGKLRIRFERGLDTHVALLIGLRRYLIAIRRTVLLATLSSACGSP